MADQRTGTKRSHNSDDAESPESKRLNLQEGRISLKVKIATCVSIIVSFVPLNFFLLRML